MVNRLEDALADAPPTDPTQRMAPIAAGAGAGAAAAAAAPARAAE
jgi:hypothetical protein